MGKRIELIHFIIRTGILFWGIALRVLSFALVTVFLFLRISASCDSKERGESFSWLIWFLVAAWFISLPIAFIYISSVVQAICHHDYTNKVFLGFHCLNVLQLLCVVILGCFPISS